MAENWIGVVVVVLSILASHALFNRELRDMRKDMSALVGWSGSRVPWTASSRDSGRRERSDDGPQTPGVPTLGDSTAKYGRDDWI